MMGIDLSALEADLSAAPHGAKCALLALADQHPEAEQVLRRAVFDVSRSAAVASAILTKNGLPISKSAITRHRQGACIACKEVSTS